MRRWLTSRAGFSVAGLLVCVLVGVVIGLGGFTFYYAEGGSYFSNDPRACVNCHIMRDHYDGWQHSSHHAAAACNDCYTPHDFVGKYSVKALNGFWHSKAFTLQDFHEPIRIRPLNARVLRGACQHCHEDLVAEVVGPGDDDGTGPSDCVRCHAAVGHGPPR